MEQIFRVLLTSKQLMFCGTRDKRFVSLWSGEGLSRKIIFSPRRTSVLLLKRTYCSKQWIVAQPKVIKTGFALKLAWNIFLLNCKLEIKWARFIPGIYYWWQSCCTWAENFIYYGLINLLDTVVLLVTFSKWVLKALRCIALLAELLQHFDPANLQMVRRQWMFIRAQGWELQSRASKEIPSTMSKSKSLFLSLLHVSVTSLRYERSGLYLEVINNLINYIRIQSSEANDQY